MMTPRRSFSPAQISGPATHGVASATKTMTRPVDNDIANSETFDAGPTHSTGVAAFGFSSKT